MQFNEYLNKKLLTEDGEFKSTLKKELILRKKDRIFPQGTRVSVSLGDQIRGNYILDVFNNEGERIKILATNGYKYLNSFIKEPSMKTFEKWNSDGIAKSLIGKSVEPDGDDEYGFPSWFKVIGVI